MTEMLYIYRCEGPSYRQEPECGDDFAIDKPMKLAARPETCPHCGRVARRVLTPHRVDVKGGTPIHHKRS